MAIKFPNCIHVMDEENYLEKYTTFKSLIRLGSIHLSFLLILSVINLLFGVLSLNFNVFDVVMKERIRMRPGLPPMENWRNFEATAFIKVYLYNVENAVEFEKKEDSHKLKLKDIGPIVYKLLIKQEDIVFEENSSLSFTTVRNLEFVKELNENGILNKSLTVVNPLLLPVASASQNNPLSAILSFDDVFLNRTVYQLLWECSSKLLDLSKKLFPIILQSSNCGILHNAFKSKGDRYNVKIGTKNGFKDFWKINTLNGKTNIPFHSQDEYDNCDFLSVVNASDGTGFSPYFNEDKITLVTPRVPRTFDLEFQQEIKEEQLFTYKYVLTNKNLMRSNDSTENYKKRCSQQMLPNGVLDASSVVYGLPIAFSNPHFYNFTGDWEKYIEGLLPNESSHSSYLVLEPTTGFPIEARAAFQSNIVVPKINYIPKLKKFSNKIIPTFWMEQSFSSKQNLKQISFIVHYLPKIQLFLTICFFISSMTFFLIFILNKFFKGKMLSEF